MVMEIRGERGSKLHASSLPEFAARCSCKLIVSKTI